MNVTEVEIPIFVNPYLFWIFEKKSSLKRHELEQELSKVYENHAPCENDIKKGEVRIFTTSEFIPKFDVFAQKVAVRRKNRWCRAIIENQRFDSSKYEVWLCDYGVVHFTNEVFKLKEIFAALPPLTKQACLNNVIFIEKNSSFEENSIDVIQNKSMIDGTYLEVDANYTLFFAFEKELNDVCFGDILYKKNFKTTSLIETLIEKKIMIKDEQSFERVAKTCGFLKRYHKKALRHASRNCKESKVDFSVLLTEIFTRQSPRGISLSKIFSESESEDSKLNLTCSSLDEMSVTEMSSFSENEEPIRKSVGKSSLSPKLQALLDRKKMSSSSTFNKSHEDESQKCETTVNSDSDSTSKKSIMRRILRKNEIESDNQNEIQSSEDSFHSCENKQISPDNSLSKSQKNEEKSPVLNIEKREETSPKLLSSVFLPSGLHKDIRGKSSKSKQDKYLSDSSTTTFNDSNNKIPRTETVKRNNHNEEVKKSEASESEWEDWKNPIRVEKGSENLIKTKCCKTCNHWTTSETWRGKPEDFNEEQHKCQHKKISKPQSLLLKEKREENVKVSTVTSNCKSKLDKAASSDILVQGRVIPTPLRRIAEAYLHETIHKSLENLNYKRARKIQSFIWPAIPRNMNVCYINKRETGKTLAYLPVVCSFMLEKQERYSELKKGGPIVTILCSNSTKCEEIYDLANKLVNGTGMNKPKILLVSYPFQHVNMSAVDVLITFPPILIELLKKNATNMKRLCHLVLEDSDILLEKYPNEINSTINVIESMLSNRIVKLNVQLIMLGEHWTMKLEKFTKKLRDIPLIAIGDYLEAAIYGRVKIHLKFVESRAKEETLINILENKWKYFKTVIVCADDQIEGIKSCLTLNSISYIVINNEFSIEDAMQQNTNWELCSGDDCKVLICTDQFLRTTSTITSAALLIHYSLPTKWSSLVKRFKCCLDNCKSPLVDNNDKLSCESFIFTDEICGNEIPRLLRLLKNYNRDVQLESLLEQTRLSQEKLKIDSKAPFCVSMKLFGYCKDETCSNRHILDSEIDSNPLFPKNGTIKFKVIQIVNVNQLRVNVIEHLDENGKITPFKSQNQVDDDELTAILNSHRETPEKIVKGNFYAYWDTEDFDCVFKKCFVQEFSREIAKILVVENGKRLSVCKDKLFELPGEDENDLCNIEVIISNFKPPFQDDDFSAKSYLTVSSIFENLSCDDNIFVADIHLQLGNTFWVKNISEKIHVFELDLTKTCLSLELIKKGLAEANEEHLKVLYKLCGDAGIVLPKYTETGFKKRAVEPKQVAPQWAFLDSENINEVLFASCVSPDEIYLRLEKFDSLLLKLEKEIMDVVIRQGGNRSCNVTPGRFYLAKAEESSQFDRVMVKRIENDSVLVFSVDFGHEAVVKLEDIRYLPDHLITKLPFQAIECRLFGLKAIDGEWLQEASDIFYDKFSLDPNFDESRILYAKSVHYEDGVFKGQSKFSVILKDSYDEKKVINNLLLDCGLAEAIPNFEISDFNISSSSEENESDEKDDGIREVQDIIDTTNMVSSNNVENQSKDKNFGGCDSELEFFLGDSDEDEIYLMKKFYEALEAAKLKKEESSCKVFKNELPAIEAAGATVDYNTPDVIWMQTKDTVSLILKIPNVETYKVNVMKSRIISFRTLVGEKDYRWHLVLFGLVKKDFSHYLTGLEVRIKLTKIDETEWPRLSQNPKRLRNVRYMFSNENFEEEKKKKLFLDIGGDESEKSDDGEEGMVTFASDMDSDMGQDLDSDSS